MPVRGSVSNRVYLELRQAIINQQFAPGTMLQEAELSRRFGTSKTPVREALGRLQAEGMVEVIPYKGYLVTQASLRDVQELFELRAHIEGVAAELAAGRASDEELARLAQLADVAYVADDAASYEEFSRVNREFHLTVARATRNRRVVALVESLLDEVQRLLYFDLQHADPAASIEEHRELVRALQARQPAAARRVMCAQILRTRERLLRGAGGR